MIVCGCGSSYGNWTVESRCWAEPNRGSQAAVVIQPPVSTDLASIPASMSPTDLSSPGRVTREVR